MNDLCPTCYGTRQVNAPCPDYAEYRSQGLSCLVVHYGPCPRCAAPVEERAIGEERPLLWTTCCEQAHFDYDGLLWCPHHHDKRGWHCLRRVRAEKEYRCVFEAAVFDADDGVAAWCERMRPNQDHSKCGVRWLLNLEEEK